MSSTGDTYSAFVPGTISPVMKMKQNFAAGPDIPLGFGMALAQNPDAMDVFSGLTQDQRRRVLEKTSRIRSKEEMRSYVDSLVGLDPQQLS